MNLKKASLIDNWRRYWRIMIEIGKAVLEKKIITDALFKERCIDEVSTLSHKLKSAYIHTARSKTLHL